jgi:steroid delta-isomerase-like uncharacterized protein
MSNAATMRRTYELINGGDLAGFAALLAEDFVEHDGAPGFPTTKDGTLAYFETVLEALPDVHMHVEDLVDGGSTTVARVTVTGTHRGDFMGIPPTGRHVEVRLIDIMRFDGAGAVREHWGVLDALTLMQQLGVIPAPAPA